MRDSCCLILILFLCFPGCTAKKNEGFQKIIGTVKIDSLYVIDLDIDEEQLIAYSSIFTKVETIILETSRESLIGNNYKFSVFENNIYILNLSNPKDFLVFDRQGKFLRKIGGIGGGPGEYTPRVFDFTFDPDNHIIYLLCDRVVNKYSTDGKFLGHISLSRHVPFIQFSNGKLYLAPQGNAYLLEEMDIETGDTKFYLKAEQYSKGWTESSWTLQGSPFRNQSSESAKFAHMFMDTLVTMQPDGIVPFLVIKSKHLIDKEDLQKFAQMGPEGRGLEMRKTIRKIFCIHKYFEAKNKICFSYLNGMGIYSVLLDTLSNSYRKGFLSNDLVFDRRDRTMFGHFFSDAEGVYEMFPSILKEDFMKLIKEGKLSPDLDKRAQLMELPEDANPVIFYYPNE